MKRTLMGFLGLVLVMASSVVVGQETTEADMESTVESLQRHVFDLEVRVGQLEAGQRQTARPTPVPTVASRSGSARVWGRVEVPTVQSLYESCTDGGLYSGAPVMLTDSDGQLLAEGTLGGGTAQGRAAERSSPDLICAYTFDFDNVPELDSYTLYFPGPGFWTAIPAFGMGPYGIVVYVDLPIGR